MPGVVTSIANRFALPTIRRCDALTLAAAVIGPLLLYVRTLPHTVVLEDDGLFLMAASHLGIAHPPGYPLHTLLGYLFTWLPFGTPAFAGHLSSAVFGALACGMVYLCARLLGTGWLPALAAAWLLGASEHFWSQAIITEVYTLNALLLFTVYALILHGVRHPAQSAIWIAAAAIYGLSLANHWPLMLLAFPGLLLAALPARKMRLPEPPRRRTQGKRQTKQRPARKIQLPSPPLLVAVALLAAALPYIWMVLRSWSEPLTSFYGPITDWEAFWRYVSRASYSKIDTNAFAGWLDRFAYLRWFGLQLFWQLTPPGCLLALLGLAILARRHLGAAASGLLVFLGNSLALILLLAFEFNDFWVAVFRPYSLVCYGMAALWLAVGLEFLSGYVRDRFSAFADRRGWVVTGLAGVAVAGMLVFLMQANWRLNDRSASDFAQHYADMIFSLLPQDAALFVYGDTEIGPLGYYRFVERRRADITLLSQQGIVYGKRLFLSKLPQERKEERLREFINETERAVFFMSSVVFPKHQSVRDHGFVKEVIRGAKPGTVELKPDAAGKRYFEYLVNLKPVDEWERTHRNKLLFAYGGFLGHIILSNNPVLLKQMQHTLELANQNTFVLTGITEILLAHGGDSHLAQIEAWFGEAQRRQSEFVTREKQARFLYLQGFLRFRQRDKDAARALFEKSRVVYPHPDNASIKALEQLDR